MIFGISLGVAVVISIDLANSSASRGFELSAETVAGRATHQITAGPDGVSDALYARLRIEQPQVTAAPIISQYVTSPQLGSRPIQLLGIDPFADAPFRGFLSAAAPSADASPADVSALAGFFNASGRGAALG